VSGLNTEERKLKGTYLKSTLSFVERNYDAEQRAQILAGISADARRVLPAIDGAAWYPIHYSTDFFHGIHRVHGDWHAANAAIQRCGSTIAEEATTTFLKLLLKVLTPKLFASKFPDFWRRYHSFGVCRVDTSRLEENRFVCWVSGYDYGYSVGAGWIEYVFQSLGKKNIEVKHNCPAGEISVPEVRWDTSWT
jgi:hypothetical protein